MSMGFWSVPSALPVAWAPGAGEGLGRGAGGGGGEGRATGLMPVVVTLRRK